MKCGVPGPLPGPSPVLRAHLVEAPQRPETELRADCAPTACPPGHRLPHRPQAVAPRERSPSVVPCMHPITRHPQVPCLRAHSSSTPPASWGFSGETALPPPQAHLVNPDLRSQGPAVPGGFSIPPPGLSAGDQMQEVRSHKG